MWQGNVYKEQGIHQTLWQKEQQIGEREAVQGGGEPQYHKKRQFTNMYFDPSLYLKLQFLATVSSL